MSGRSARGIGMPRCAHSRPSACSVLSTSNPSCATGASAFFSVFACLFECLSAVCQASKLGDSLEDRYPSFDCEKIKQGQAQLGWAGELEQAAALVGEQWQPFMTVATATEAGLYKT